MKSAAMVLAFATAALVSLGLVAVISSEVEVSWGSQAGTQVLSCGIGLVVAAVFAVLDYRWLKSLAWPAWLLAVGSLVAVLVLGELKNSSRRWLELGGVSLQPSEFAKLAVILVLARYGAVHQRAMSTWWRGLVYPGLVVGVVLGLVFLQPDWGTTMLIAAVSGVMLLVAGVRWLHLVPVAVLGVVLLACLLVQNPTRWNRGVGWWNDDVPSAVTFQTDQAKLALGSGGLSGTGLGQGQHYGRVPGYRTDFMFALIGEELGFLGTAGVVLAFGIFVVAGVMIGWNAKDTFGLLLASGLAMLIGLQALINIGVVTSVFPNKGLALPFLSKGGSNLLAMLMLVGILFSVARTTAREGAAAEPVSELDELGATQAI